MYDDSPPVWTFLEPPPVLPEQTVPEVPEEVRAWTVRLEEPPQWWDLERDGDDAPIPGQLCPRSGASEMALGVFDSAWAVFCQAKARLLRAAQTVHEEAVELYGSDAGRYVADELALRTNLHPRSMEALLGQGFAITAVPGLLGLLERGELAEQHLNALLEESACWSEDPAERAEVIALTLQRCRERLARGEGWPSPALLRRRLRTAAILRHLTREPHDRARPAQRRKVEALLSGASSASLVIDGPAVSVARMADAIRARAEAMGRQPGDTRTLDQRMFDAAEELLTIDADGGPSAVPTLDDTGEHVGLSVRHVEVTVVMPHPRPHDPDPGEDGPGGGPDPDPARTPPDEPPAGADRWQQVWGELPELVGLGPVTPDLALDLLSNGARARRAVVHPDSGALLAVDDPVPPPRRAARRAAARCCDPDEVLARLRAAPVVTRDLVTDAYRPGTRLRRFVRLRDRCCVFPGCAVTARFCDLDHVKQHHLGGRTCPSNTHCLCRRHHQAKQSGLFTVHRNTAGQTIWTTRDGHEHTAPPRAG